MMPPGVQGVSSVSYVAPCDSKKPSGLLLPPSSSVDRYNIQTSTRYLLIADVTTAVSARDIALMALSLRRGEGQV